MLQDGEQELPGLKDETHNVPVLSLHHDDSTVTGERRRVRSIHLAEPPFFWADPPGDHRSALHRLRI